MKIHWIYGLLFLSLLACQPSKDQARDASVKLKVVTTTGMLYDAVINITGDQVDAKALMGPGVDPHLYKATQGDLNKLTEADLIIYNGLMLEGKMGEIFEKLATRKAVCEAAGSIDKSRLRSPVHANASYDPHVWFDVKLWQEAVKKISKTLISLDSANRKLYEENTSRYLTKLDSLDTYVREEIATIPEAQRILVTAHDAFGYYGDAYDIRVEGLQGISTVSEFGLRDISELTDIIISNKVKAIFVETSVSDKAIKAVINGCKEKGHDVKIGGSLYSDAMGAFGTFEGTYIGMVTKNTQTIVTALK